MPQPPKSRRRRRLFRLVLLAFVLVMALLAAEVLLRLLWTPPEAFARLNVPPSWEEPEPGTFEPVAGFVGEFQVAIRRDLPPSARTDPRILDVRINAAGLRGPELGDKQPGERRILIGGDSLPFGYGVADDESFPALLERQLRDSGVSITVCNAGVPAYGFAASCKRVTRLRDKVQADVLVVCYFLGNDFVNDIAQRSTIVVAGRMFDGAFGNLLRQSWRGRLAVHSRLSQCVESWLFVNEPEWSLQPWFCLAPDQAAMQASLPSNQTEYGLFLDAPREHVWNAGHAPAVSLWLQDLEQSMRTLVERAGDVPVLVVVLPTQLHFDAESRAKLLADVHLDPKLLQLGSSQLHIEQVCDRFGLPCLDATIALAAAGTPASLYIMDRIHLSVRGNQVVASALAERLQSLMR